MSAKNGKQMMPKPETLWWFFYRLIDIIDKIFPPFQLENLFQWIDSSHINNNPSVKH